MKFRISHMLWVTSLFAVALSAYPPISGLLAACAVITYWLIIIRWYEDEHEIGHVIRAMTFPLLLLEGTYLNEFHWWPRLIPLAALVILAILPVWRKREPWYDRML